MLTYYSGMPAAQSPLRSSRRDVQRNVHRDVFHAVGDSTRRQLIDLLGRGEQPVNTLAARFSMTRPAISQHLRVLRLAGLVSVRRLGRERRYRLRAERLREVYDWVAHYDRFWQDKLKALGSYLDEQEKKGRS
jgi:DNA-binding transcriptional ArsR family regulator